MQSVVRLVYPPQCLTCDAMTDADFALCGHCWRETPFITGLVCDACGLPLVGEGHPTSLCDDCMTVARPWSQGRSALLYGGNARRLVLGLKHGDRTDLAQPMATWMLSAGAPLLSPDICVVPVPNHWSRRIARRYNQSAILAKAVARGGGFTFLPRTLIRPSKTPLLDGHSRENRFATLLGAIEPHPTRGKEVAGRKAVLIDDVMTSGATLAAATVALFQAGAAEVSVLTLARVAKAP
ncbi:double zinc ribbon domain-containing protein [Aestuariibius sp. 2305UL40-4]|uniref:double zinc ribbon domain-containing protein n=1 Tax=Aestuariibius violaceus TaxID=3234132 RepID=UPI00345F0623